MTTCACFVVVNHSALSTSRRKVPVKRSLYPFSLGEPGWILMLRTRTPGRCRCERTQVAVAQDEPVEDLQHIAGRHPDADLHGQGLAGVLVEHRQHLVTTTVAQLVVNEIDAPGVIGMRWSEPDD